MADELFMGSAKGFSYVHRSHEAAALLAKRTARFFSTPVACKQPAASQSKKMRAKINLSGSLLQRLVMPLALGTGTGSFRCA
jgi:hypothetical protein